MAQIFVGKRTLVTDVYPLKSKKNLSTHKRITSDLGEPLLNPGVHRRAGNPEVAGIPQVDSSTSQRQLTSTHAEVNYLIKPPITTKPVVRTN